MKDNFMNIEEASEFLETSTSTLYEMTTKRKIPHYRDEHRVYFKKEEMIEFLKENVIPISIEENSSVERKRYFHLFLEKVEVI